MGSEEPFRIQQSKAQNLSLGGGKKQYYKSILKEKPKTSRKHFAVQEKAILLLLQFLKSSGFIDQH